MSHKLEIAATGRARCRGCKEALAKGVLRFAEEFKNPYSEDGGMSYRYWHLACAATKMANDLAPAIAAYVAEGGEVPDREALDALIAEHRKPEMPFAERAPNARAKCRACQEAIAKGELRVAFERMYEGPMGMQKGAAYAHARCLLRYLAREVEQGREAPAPDALMAMLASRGTVGPEDLAELRAALAPPPA